MEFDSTRISSGEVASKLIPHFPVYDLQIDQPTVESIVRRLYEGELGWDGAEERSV